MPNDVNLKLRDDSRITATSLIPRIIINIKLNPEVEAATGAHLKWPNQDSSSKSQMSFVTVALTFFYDRIKFGALNGKLPSCRESKLRLAVFSGSHRG